MRSSLGFHTMTLSLNLDCWDYSQLIKDFTKYSHDTGLIQMYYVDGRENYIKYQPANDNSAIPIYLIIKYYQEDRGIKWQIRCNTWGQGSTSYFVEATINPKILGGIHDYTTAATYDDMEATITNFNLESSRISSILKDFNYYKLTRIDYCVNFDLNELAPGCDPELMMNLIKRENIPSHYKEWTEYDDTAHRNKSRPGSFYLKNLSVNINCYSKYMQLQERSRKNESNGFPPIPQATLDAARGIIRFEVQCKYHKVYNYSSRAKESGNHNYNKYEDLLTHETCIGIIDSYFKEVIGRGDWYTLQDAIRKIESHNFNQQKEDRLIDALKIVNQCRSLAKAKNTFQDKEQKAFKRTIKELFSLNINPVTIPKEWGINHIPNLLYAYYDKVGEEKSKQQMEEFQKELLGEYYEGYSKHIN